MEHHHPQRILGQKNENTMHDCVTFKPISDISHGSKFKTNSGFFFIKDWTKIIINPL